jgi:hypothetical protein
VDERVIVDADTVEASSLRSGDEKVFRVATNRNVKRCGWPLFCGSMLRERSAADADVVYGTTCRRVDAARSSDVIANFLQLGHGVL